MLRRDRPASLRCGNQVLDISAPVVMGILNATPDSFFAPSRTLSPDDALTLAETMISEGADILDIGGMSSRPGAPEIPEEEELQRVLPVIKTIHKRFPYTILSIDTYRSRVAKACIEAGAGIVNDISAGQLDDKMYETVAMHKAAYVLMHMKGTPATMQSQAVYGDLVKEMMEFFIEKVNRLHHNGIREYIIDPGFGFSKTMEHNYELIRRLGVFQLLGGPVMIGVSRKSTLSKTIDRPAEETLHATTALHMKALLEGASILRVHDVQPAWDAIQVYKQIRGNSLK